MAFPAVADVINHKFDIVKRDHQLSVSMRKG
jgi:hypothetical protein